jgi:hypothetical protein
MPHQAHNPNNYGRAPMSAPPQAIAPNPHTNLLNIYVIYRFQIKRGFNHKKNSYIHLHSHDSQDKH